MWRRFGEERLVVRRFRRRRPNKLIAIVMTLPFPANSLLRPNHEKSGHGMAHVCGIRWLEGVVEWVMKGCSLPR